MMRPLSGRGLVAAMLVAEVASMAGFSTFPALMPGFIAEWHLTNTEAGWINGLYFAGYTLAGPFLVGLTDRIDPRRIYLLSAAVTSVSLLAFALFADGFVTAAILRTLSGIGLAGTYMPGLKALSDRFEGPTQSRAVAVYTASFGVGASISFATAGWIAEMVGWPATFVVGACGAAVAFVIVALCLQPESRERVATEVKPLDFRPVLRNRTAMGYVLAYTFHNCELFGVRSWIVAFLVFSQSLQPDGAAWWSPPLVAAAMNLVGWPASVLGNEASVRFGRRRVVIAVMAVSALYSCIVGFGASLPFILVVAMVMIYGVTVTGDSASITAGTIAASPPGQRGVTMAVHSSVGFAGASLGPILFGVVLDAAGGGSTSLHWAIAFASIGAIAVLGPIAVALLVRDTSTAR
jgi:MFS family permease